MELFFFGRAGQCGNRRRTTLDHGSQVVEVAGADFLLVSYEGVILCDSAASLGMCCIAMVVLPDCRQGLFSPEVTGRLVG